jgi:hypothetical protein
MLEKSENENKTPSPRLRIFLENVLSDYTKKEGNLIQKVNEIGAYVKNEKFLNAFKLDFKNNIVQTHLCIMKWMDSRSPLYLLWQNAKQNRNIKLTVELMEICTDAIGLNTTDIYSGAIGNPDENSFISVILFDPYFQKFNIHQTAVNGLKNLLISKKETGVQLNDLTRTKQFSRKQKQQFDKIWQYIQRFCGQQPSMEVLLNTAHKEMEEKSAVKEKVQTCLTTYCKNANDIQQYQLAITQLADQLTNSAIKSIQIPDDILRLVEFADVLYPYSTSRTWLNFQQNIQNNIVISKFNRIFAVYKSHC